MGLLTYDSKLTAAFDDRVLAHLQAVIWSKIRRGEAFSFTWSESLADGSGRKSIWISPNIPLVFEYFGSRPPALNANWVQALSKSANSTAGLQLVPEPPATQSS